MSKTSIHVALEASPGDEVFVMKDNRVRRGVVKDVVIKVRESGDAGSIEVDQHLTVIITTPGFRYTETRYPREIGTTLEELFEKLEHTMKGGH